LGECDDEVLHLQAIFKHHFFYMKNPIALNDAKDIGAGQRLVDSKIARGVYVNIHMYDPENGQQADPHWL